MEVMATNKETLTVIAQGVEKSEADRWITELNEMVFDIAAVLAYQTVDQFMKIAESLDMESIKPLLFMLENLDTEQAVAALQAIFCSHGMPDAAQAMELLDICSPYDDGVYDYFIDEFMGSDEIDWFLVEICLKENSAVQTKETPPEQEDA